MNTYPHLAIPNVACWPAGLAILALPGDCLEMQTGLTPCLQNRNLHFNNFPTDKGTLWSWGSIAPMNWQMTNQTSLPTTMKSPCQSASPPAASITMRRKAHQLQRESAHLAKDAGFYRINRRDLCEPLTSQPRHQEARKAERLLNKWRGANLPGWWHSFKSEWFEYQRILTGPWGKWWGSWISL